MTVRQLQILIVDDDHDNASSLSELLEFEGHIVTVVHSGEQAVAAYLGGDFDIAFMDVMMPGKNGVESFLEIKRLKPAARVVMMTGFSVEQLLNQAMENGALGILTKPMDSSRVLGLLDDVGPGGVVVAAAGQTGEHMHRILSQAGRPCRLIREARGITLESADDRQSVLIFDIQRPLIESIGYYAQLRGKGCGSNAVIMLGAARDASESADVLRDFSVTGVLNKPFDPMVLLQRLGDLAA